MVMPRDPGRPGRILGRWIGRTATRPAAKRAEGRVIAVASGKGGTGKSFLATSLAVLAHQRGLRTLVVDCDFGLASAHLLFGVHPERTLQHLLAGADADVRVETPYGPRLVAGGSGVQELTSLSSRSLERLAASFGRWAADEDLVILDLGAGVTAQGLIVMGAAELAVLVTQPEIAALTDAYAVLKCMHRHARVSPEFAVVANRVLDSDQGHRTFRKLDEVAGRFVGARLHYLGGLPEEHAVSQRRLGQSPLVVSHPSCQIAHDLEAVLDQLSSLLEPMGRSIPEVGVQDRMLRAMREFCHPGEPGSLRRGSA